MQKKDKYFIAIVPPEPYFSILETLKQEISRKYGTLAALRSPAHITLHMPFEFLGDKEERLTEALKNELNSKKFSITVSGFAGFEPSVVFAAVIINPELVKLRSMAIDAMKKLQVFNELDNKRAFHPHITLAFRDLKKELYFTIMEDYATKELSYNFEVDTVTLLKHCGKNWLAHKKFSLE